MIISCTNCNKKFEIDLKLIPTDGRLLECGSCNHQWYFKNTRIEEEKNISNDTQLFNKNLDDEDTLGETLDDNFSVKKNSFKNLNNVKKINNFGFLKKLLIFIITLISIILVLDTFKGPLSTFIPDLDIILKNLFETIHDIFLLVKNLI
jgi:predicted Zn finger-like uncharacterized protein|tara:strand:+ start:122 stop:568 length:447 start_codon:yes stop_codon:yes gene_type:complete